MSEQTKTGGSRPRRGLGNGLGSLIPSAPAQRDQSASSSRPLDVLFPGSSDLRAHDVSQPSQGSAAVRGGNVSRETSKGFQTPRTATLKTERKDERATSRAVDALMSATIVSRETSDDDDALDLVAVPGAAFAQLDIEQIIPNSRQPREVFLQEELEELSASIREVGVLQPIVVRTIRETDEPTETLRHLLKARPNAHYELIMGERRLRASELAGLTTIPAIIRETEDDDLLRDALLENLHRVQLNPLEEASAYQQLMADFGATQEELSKKIARSRSQIANTIRLLNLPPNVQKLLASGQITAGHARALLGFTDAADMEVLAQRIVNEGLSVRTTEELVRLRLPRRSVGERQPKDRPVSELAQSVVNAFRTHFAAKVTVAEGRRKGKIVIEYSDADDLRRISELLTQNSK